MNQMRPTPTHLASMGSSLTGTCYVSPIFSIDRLRDAFFAIVLMYPHPKNPIIYCKILKTINLAYFNKL